MKRLQSTILALCLGAAAAWGQSPAATTPGSDAADRRIAPQDVLTIVIVGEPGLPTDYRVSASGEIQFPFLDVVPVKGLTPRELDLRLEELLAKDYFVSPDVLVSVREYRQEFVIVIGAVNRPGNLPMSAEQKMDILDAIASAGGTTRSAKNSVEHTRDGVRKVYSLDKLKSESDPSRKVILKPGDILEIKESVF
jgi:polysaccharide export outer membrane protein